MKSIKEVEAVTQKYVNTNIRIVRYQFLCISSFGSCFSFLSRESHINGKETRLLFKASLVYNATHNQASYLVKTE